MKVSELIKRLQKELDTHGDSDVEFIDRQMGCDISEGQEIENTCSVQDGNGDHKFFLTNDEDTILG